MQVVLGSNLGLIIILCPPLIIIFARDRVCNLFPKSIPIESGFFAHRRRSWPTRPQAAVLVRCPYPSPSLSLPLVFPHPTPPRAPRPAPRALHPRPRATPLHSAHAASRPCRHLTRSLPPPCRRAAARPLPANAAASIASTSAALHPCSACSSAHCSRTTPTPHA